MTFEDDAKLIAGYNEWVTQRRIMANDVTPEAYLADRMKIDAADRVIKALDFIETFGEWNQGQGWYELLNPNDTQVREIELILRGTV